MFNKRECWLGSVDIARVVDVDTVEPTPHNAPLPYIDMADECQNTVTSMFIATAPSLVAWGRQLGLPRIAGTTAIFRNCWVNHIC